ncbi:hypothetical protein ACWGB8_18940 [Kitasatospora sp. NPDC054939]
MGYHTEFTGRIAVRPPLNQAERTYLRDFARTRRMHRAAGPYYVGGPGYEPAGRGRRPKGADDVHDANLPPQGQPGLWCSWEPTDDGSAIEWNQMEKFSFATEWMQYLVDHFLKPGAAAQGRPGFEEFTFDHVLDGTVDASGEEPGDLWQLVVRANTATTVTISEPYDGDPDWICTTCLRLLDDEDSTCCPGADTAPSWPA